MLVQCCVCMKIEIGDQWQPADSIIYDASHAYCPDCESVAREEILAFQNAFRSACIHAIAKGSGRRLRVQER